MIRDGTYFTDVAPGVHLIEHAYTNCYVIEAETGLTLVDAAYPRTWLAVERCLQAVGRSPAEIRDLIITHGHFDHVGFASLVGQRLSIPIWAHSADHAIVHHPYRYRPEHPRLLTPLTHPRSWPIMVAMVRAGALRVTGCEPDAHLETVTTAELPGSPQVIHTPGHTDGECVIHLPSRQILITGDALVTLDPYTGQRGPRIISRSATHDAAEALDSLSALTHTEASHLLPGHGAVWHGEIATAVQLARNAHLLNH